MARARVVVIGAGIGGLVAAMDLAANDMDVTVLEKMPSPGGKIRDVRICDRAVGSGPTVLTMKSVFEAVFEDAQLDLSDYLTLRPLEKIARHAWDDTGFLDLFSDVEKTTDAIGAFSGAKSAREYEAFCAMSKRIYDSLEDRFMFASKPSQRELIARFGFRGFRQLLAIKPYATLWRELCRIFSDRRLCQLFARYATYCGSSPFAAPATLMLVAHVERNGVWTIDGGLTRLAGALCRAATERGVEFWFDTHVSEIELKDGLPSLVRCESGEEFRADAIVTDVDVAAVAGGALGGEICVTGKHGERGARSLSAVTWSRLARPSGFPLAHHNVFFSHDYETEFRDIFDKGRVPRDPTVYICAQDRGNDDAGDRYHTEPIFTLINAPPDGDLRTYTNEDIAKCSMRSLATMERCGLAMSGPPEEIVTTTPNDFHRMFPATGGALYGRASHGPTATFKRPGSRTNVQGIYMAGGSIHPGPGLPMAAISGRLAVSTLLSDLALAGKSHPAVIPGGTSMR